MSLAEKSAIELLQMLGAGETTCREVMEAVLGSIDDRESSVGAFLFVRDKQELLKEASDIDARRARGEAIGSLAGLPIAIKDNICVEGTPTTCASKILEGFMPPFSATVIHKIQAADGIIIGKTNMDEFAMGSSTENSAYHPTHNPHKLDCVPGGTSGGSAAAMAANECILALGSDTGGSIRQPASFCGVVGLKPTYGRVSRYGVVAYGSSLDQIGPIGKSVADVALLFAEVAGHDPLDSTSIAQDVPDYRAQLSLTRPLRIGVPGEYFAEGLDEEVRASVQATIDLLKKDGHEIVDVSLPHTEYAVPAYYIIACAEASANLARFDGVRYGLRVQNTKNFKDITNATRSKGFGNEVQRRIILGTYVLSSGYFDAYYLKAQKVRTLIRMDFDKAFQSCDIIMHPVAPTAAYRIGEKCDDPLAMYLGDIYSVTANLVGIPAISIPCGWTEDGRPIGLQLGARPLAEPLLLAAAARVESLLQEASIWPSDKGKAAPK